MSHKIPSRQIPWDYVWHDHVLSLKQRLHVPQAPPVQISAATKPISPADFQARVAAASQALFAELSAAPPAGTAPASLDVSDLVVPGLDDILAASSLQVDVPAAPADTRWLSMHANYAGPSTGAAAAGRGANAATAPSAATAQSPRAASASSPGAAAAASGAAQQRPGLQQPAQRGRHRLGQSSSATAAAAPAPAPSEADVAEMLRGGTGQVLVVASPTLEVGEGTMAEKAAAKAAAEALAKQQLELTQHIGQGMLPLRLAQELYHKHRWVYDALGMPAPAAQSQPAAALALAAPAAAAPAAAATAAAATAAAADQQAAGVGGMAAASPAAVPDERPKAGTAARGEAETEAAEPAAASSSASAAGRRKRRATGEPEEPPPPPLLGAYPRPELLERWRTRFVDALGTLKSLQELLDPALAEEEAVLRGKAQAMAADALAQPAVRKRTKTTQQQQPAQAASAVAGGGFAPGQGGAGTAAAGATGALPGEGGAVVAEDEVVVHVCVYPPGRADLPSQELLLLGSNTLQQLAAAVRCQRVAALGAPPIGRQAANPPPLPHAAGAAPPPAAAAQQQAALQHPPAFLFIEGCFYVDSDAAGTAGAGPAAEGAAPQAAPPGTTLQSIAALCAAHGFTPGYFDGTSAALGVRLQPAADATAAAGADANGANANATAAAAPAQPLRMGSMRGTRLRDVTLRVSSRPCHLYSHLGCCEHLIQIKDVRSWHPQDPRAAAAYPLLVANHRQLRPRQCYVCGTGGAATVVTFNDPVATACPCFMCFKCYDALHLDERGIELFPDARVLPYVPDAM